VHSRTAREGEVVPATNSTSPGSRPLATLSPESGGEGLALSRPIILDPPLAVAKKGKRPMRYMIGLAALMLACSAQAADIEFSGASLQKICDNATKGSPDEGVCKAYIAGVRDGLSLAPAFAAQGRAACLPTARDSRAALADTVTAVMKFMRVHPGELDVSAGLVVSSAILEAYPCQKAN
jgi:hypothetical protein